MAACITDEHFATFATESTWDGLAEALRAKYGGAASRVVLYNAAANPERAVRRGGTAAVTGVSTKVAITNTFIQPGCAERLDQTDERC
jgi:hypothetical protein